MVGEVWVVNENRELLYSQLLSPNYNTAAQEALWRSCQVVLLFPRRKTSSELITFDFVGSTTSWSSFPDPVVFLEEGGVRRSRIGEPVICEETLVRSFVENFAQSCKCNL